MYRGAPRCLNCKHLLQCTPRHAEIMSGGQVVAGSNPVSPTKFAQVKCYFYLLPKPAQAGALDLVSTTARNRRIVAWRKTVLDLRVLSKVRRPDGRDEFSASCDTQVGRRRPRIPFTRRNKPLTGLSPSRGGTIGHDCCGSGCHRLVTSGRRTQRRGRLPRAGSVCCVEQAQ